MVLLNMIRTEQCFSHLITCTMKHVVKILSILVTISAIWVGLLQTSIVPRSHTWLVSQFTRFKFHLSACFCLFLLACLGWPGLVLPSSQLPIYFVVSLGCYGLLMVGVGLMQFPTCPQEALLLQQVLYCVQLYLVGCKFFPFSWKDAAKLLVVLSYLNDS